MVQPGRMRRLSTALASDGSTLSALLPESCVIATVVRNRAAVSGEASADANRRGAKRRGCAMARDRMPPAKGASSLKKVSVAGVSEKGKGRRDSRSRARPSTATACTRGGLEACPGFWATVSSISRKPFSSTPTSARGVFTPGKIPSVTALPSSRVQAKRIPRPASQAAASRAPSMPERSSSPPKANQRSRWGLKPEEARASAASSAHTRLALVSIAPRAQT